MLHAQTPAANTFSSRTPVHRKGSTKVDSEEPRTDPRMGDSVSGAISGAIRIRWPGGIRAFWREMRTV
jgi:hypothetical protein